MSFNFGSTNPPAFGTPNPAAGSITFGTPMAQPQVGGLFGTPASSAAPSFGFGSAVSAAPNFGANPANTGLSFGTPANTGLAYAAPANTNLSFGAPANTNLSFGAPANTNLSFGAPANTNLSFGAPANTNLSFGAPANTGLSFGAPVSTGLSFGTPSANFGVTAPIVSTAASSFNFGTAAPTLGSFGAPKATGALNFGTGTMGLAGFGKNTAAPTLGTLGFGLSGANQTTSLLGASTTSTAPTGGLNFGFGGAAGTLGGPGATLGGLGSLTTKPLTTITPSLGLGGIAGSLGTTTKLGGVATNTMTTTRTEVSAKEQHLPNEILQTVEAFKVFIKQQEQYCSDISKVSIKEFKKVKEDIDSINSKLSTTEKQLQSNNITAKKLKYDTAKSLQQIEMAQRTHDTPPGLQYDNNAPLLFFMELVDSFEKDMQQIKLQIETTDKYVSNLDRASPLTSNDLSLGLRRLHDTFVALAGRLQSIHSQVEYQKEQYLNYRRFMLRDEETVSNVFERPTAEADALQIALRSIDAYHGLSKLGQTHLGRLSEGADSGNKDNPLATTAAQSASKLPASGPTPFGTSLDQTNVVQAQHQQHMQQQQQQQQHQAVQQATTLSGTGTGLNITLPLSGLSAGVGLQPAGPPPPYPGTSGLFSSPTANIFGSPIASSGSGSLAPSPGHLGSYSLTQGSSFPLQKPPVGTKRGKP